MSRPRSAYVTSNGNTARNGAALAAHITVSNPAVIQRLGSTAEQPMREGLDAVMAQRIATIGLAKAAAGQASVIAFETAFLAVALLFVCAAPILIAVRLGVSRLHATLSIGLKSEL